jgi:hypothetical protein
MNEKRGNFIKINTLHTTGALNPIIGMQLDKKEAL